MRCLSVSFSTLSMSPSNLCKNLIYLTRMPPPGVGGWDGNQMCAASEIILLFWIQPVPIESILKIFKMLSLFFPKHPN